MFFKVNTSSCNALILRPEIHISISTQERITYVLNVYLCLFDEYNGLESELLCEKIFVLEKRGEEGLIVWRKEFAIYIFLLFCNMSNDQIFYHYYNVWQSHLFALFIDFSTHSLFYCLQWWHGLVVNIQEITKVLSLSDYRRIVDKL